MADSTGLVSLLEAERRMAEILDRAEQEAGTLVADARRDAARIEGEAAAGVARAIATVRERIATEEQESVRKLQTLAAGRIASYEGIAGPELDRLAQLVVDEAIREALA